MCYYLGLAVNKKSRLAAGFVLLLLFSLLARVEFVDLAVANPDASSLSISMPEEYVNYTIICVNGTWWAKIDGTYPIYVRSEAEGDLLCVLPDLLPMVYPTPPNTTNIHVKLNETELDWSKYLYGTHHTAIGNWSMIYCILAPVSDHLVLKIHYEHPVQLVNGSRLFLYDLNIREYLWSWSPKSTAYFTIRMETNASNLQAFTTETDVVWKPINYTSSWEGSTEIITLQIYSEYARPLLGDLVIMFSDVDTEATAVPLWVVIPKIIVIAVLVAAVIYGRRRRQKANNQLQN